MGNYDVNLKKTRIGYQFDHNVYIGYQVNDNRVVTFKDLKGFVGGGGGGGSVSDVTLEFQGQDFNLKVNGVTKSTGTVNVSTLTFAAGATVPTGAVICLVDPNDGTVYQSTTTWSTIADQLAELANLSITTAGGVTTIAPQSGGTLVLDGTASKVAHPLQLSIGGTSYTYDGSTGVNVSLGAIGTVAAGTMSIALPNAASASDNDIPTIGYIKNSGLGGNLYSTEHDPWGTRTSSSSTQFIFVED